MDLYKITKHLNFVILSYFPRHSVRFAKDFFKGRPITAVEIGTQDGEHAENILKELNVKKIYLVDPFEKYEEYFESEGHQTQGRLSRMERIARKRLRKSSRKVSFIKKYSDDAVDDIPNGVDFIYVDGNHECEYVKRDLKNYWGKVKDGGILAGHDIAASPGVGHALIEFCYERKLKPYITRTDFWIVKNESSKTKGR